VFTDCVSPALPAFLQPPVPAQPWRCQRQPDRNDVRLSLNIVFIVDRHHAGRPSGDNPKPAQPA